MFYGLTECASTVSVGRYERSDQCFHSGFVLPHVNLSFSKDQILISSLSICKGYEFVDQTIQSVSSKRFVTSDLGYMKNNALYVKGRVDNAVTIQGETIQLEQLESFVTSLDGVDQIIFVFVDVSDYSGLVGYVSSKKDRGLLLYDIQQNIKQHFSGLWVPKYLFELVDGGKPSRYQLFQDALNKLN